MNWSKRFFLKVIAFAPLSLLIFKTTSGQTAVQDTCLANSIGCLLEQDGEVSEDDLEAVKIRALDTYAQNERLRTLDLDQIEPISSPNLSQFIWR